MTPGISVMVSVQCRCGAWEPLDVEAKVRGWSRDPETIPPTVTASLRWELEHIVLPTGWEVRHPHPLCPDCLKRAAKEG